MHLGGWAVALGGGGTVDFAVVVDNPLPAGVTQVDNVVSISDDGSNGADANPDNNDDDDSTPVIAAPDMQISKGDGGISIVPGDTIIYTLTFANVGNQAANGVVITETVPANTHFSVSGSTSGWSCVPDNGAGNNCTLAVGAVAGGGGGGSVEFALVVDNPLPAGVTQISNTASISDDGSNGDDPNLGDNTASKSTSINANFAGRMTGGGRLDLADRVTHGFQLHCDIAESPNNLQVNFGKGNKFHLEELTSALCSDDPNIGEGDPAAGFDTFVGSGTGRYNGASGATIAFTFTDAGEPGRNDIATILIVDALGNTVLDVSAKLKGGNHQAHLEE